MAIITAKDGRFGEKMIQSSTVGACLTCPEILFHIVQHLEAKDLVSCVRVNRIFFNVAGRKLYRIIPLDAGQNSLIYDNEDYGQVLLSTDTKLQLLRFTEVLCCTDPVVCSKYALSRPDVGAWFPLVDTVWLSSFSSRAHHSLRNFPDCRRFVNQHASGVSLSNLARDLEYGKTFAIIDGTVTPRSNEAPLWTVHVRPFDPGLKTRTVLMEGSDIWGGDFGSVPLARLSRYHSTSHIELVIVPRGQILFHSAFLHTNRHDGQVRSWNVFSDGERYQPFIRQLAILAVYARGGLTIVNAHSLDPRIPLRSRPPSWDHVEEDQPTPAQLEACMAASGDCGSTELAQQAVVARIRRDMLETLQELRRGVGGTEKGTPECVYSSIKGKWPECPLARTRFITMPDYLKEVKWWKVFEEDDIRDWLDLTKQ